MKESCSNCRFWYNPEPLLVKTGQCRRHAPQSLMREGVEPWPVWPTTGGDVWCGDWKPQPRIPHPDEISVLKSHGP